MTAAFFIVVIVMNCYLLSAESRTIPTCNGYVCGDGTCINGTRCDGVVQCPDGSDELRCRRQSYYCTSSQFRCSSSSSYYYSRCISSSRRCDGTRDCSDGSDERNCYSGSCYYCRRYSSSSSIFCSRRCDGRIECYDESDEQNCPTNSYNSALAGIIAGSVIGFLLLISCPIVIIIIVVCIIYHATKSGRRTVTTTTTPVGGNTSTTTSTTPGETTNQPGFQLQNLGYEKSAAQPTEDATISELTQQAPPPYGGMKPVLYRPNK